MSKGGIIRLHAGVAANRREWGEGGNGLFLFF